MRRQRRVAERRIILTLPVKTQTRPSLVSTSATSNGDFTFSLDLGDRKHHAGVLNAVGELVHAGSLLNTRPRQPNRWRMISAPSPAPPRPKQSDACSRRAAGYTAARWAQVECRSPILKPSTYKHDHRPCRLPCYCFALVSAFHHPPLSGGDGRAATADYLGRLWCRCVGHHGWSSNRPQMISADMSPVRRKRHDPPKRLERVPPPFPA